MDNYLFNNKDISKGMNTGIFEIDEDFSKDVGKENTSEDEFEILDEVCSLIFCVSTIRYPSSINRVLFRTRKI